MRVKGLLGRSSVEFGQQAVKIFHHKVEVSFMAQTGESQFIEIGWAGPIPCDETCPMPQGFQEYLYFMIVLKEFFPSVLPFLRRGLV